MENNEQFVPEQEERIPEQEELTPVENVIIPEKQGYTPRPAWQVWAARIGLVVFILVLIIYYMVYFRGGR